jgi:hypothetical protein
MFGLNRLLVPRYSVGTRGFAVLKNLKNTNSSANKVKSKVDEVVRNEKIKFPEVRVVFEDDATGKSNWQVLSRGDALKLAKSKKMDLILGYIILTTVQNVDNIIFSSKCKLQTSSLQIGLVLQYCQWYQEEGRRHEEAGA